MNDPNLAGTLEQIDQYVRGLVAGSFRPDDQIVEDAIDVYRDDAPADVLRAHAERSLARAVAGHRAEQATWHGLTDCDRLDAAFAELESRGIVARQNFSCCGNCGAAEIGEPIAEAEATGRPLHGYCFYHLQDTESAVEGHGLHLNYGSTMPFETEADRGRYESACVKVGREIVAALQGNGLKTEWDGTLGRRIRVRLKWKRRRK